MAKVICKLPNASSNISGIEFTALPGDGGMISEEISDERALDLSSINGYELAASDADPELDALRKRALELNIANADSKGAKRLKAEIPAAEAAAAAKIAADEAAAKAAAGGTNA